MPKKKKEPWEPYGNPPAAPMAPIVPDEDDEFYEAPRLYAEPPERVSMAELKDMYLNWEGRPQDLDWPQFQPQRPPQRRQAQRMPVRRGYALGGFVGDMDEMMGMGDESMSGLGDQFGLDPREWDLGYEPQAPKLKPRSGAYRNILDRVGPVVASAFHESDWDNPFARMAARLARGVGEHIEGGVQNREQDIVSQNQAEAARVAAENAANKQTAMANRAAYRAALKERMPKPRALVERHLKEIGDEEGARVAARSKAYREAGLNPPGTPPKAKPKTPAKAWNPTSFRLFSDADKIAIDELTDELKALKSDYPTAFEPARTGGDPKRIADARARATAINGQIHGARKASILYHLRALKAEAAADPKTARAKADEVYRAAVALKLSGDKEVDAAGRELAAAIKGAPVGATPEVAPDEVEE